MVVGGSRSGIASSGCCGAFASCSPALIDAKMSSRVGGVGGGGGGRPIAPGEVVNCWVLGVLLYGEAGGGVVLWCQLLWDVV